MRHRFGYFSARRLFERWTILFLRLPQLGLNLFNRRQPSPDESFRDDEAFRDLFEMPELRDAHWRRGVPQRVFGDDPILRLAENQADARLVVRVAEHVVNGGEVEVHLAGVFRFEGRHLQVDDAEASELEVVEEQIELEVFATDFKRNLAPDVGEAGARFDEELAQVFQQASFQVALLSLGGESEKSKL